MLITIERRASCSMFLDRVNNLLIVIFCHVGSHSWFISEGHVTARPVGAPAFGAKSPGEGRFNTPAWWTTPYPHADTGRCYGSRHASVSYASANRCHGATASNHSPSAAASLRLPGDQWTDALCTHVTRRHQRTGVYCYLLIYSCYSYADYFRLSSGSEFESYQYSPVCISVFNAVSPILCRRACTKAVFPLICLFRLKFIARIFCDCCTVNFMPRMWTREFQIQLDIWQQNG